MPSAFNPIRLAYKPAFTVMVILAAATLTGAAEDPPWPAGLERLPSLVQDPGAMVNLVQAYESLAPLDAGRIANAQRAYEFILAKHPDQPRALVFLGELLYDKRGQFEKAAQLWEKAAEKDPAWGRPWTNLGMHACHQGEYKTGLETLQKAVQCDPEQPDYLFNLVQAYLLYAPQMQELTHWNAATLYREAMKLSQKAAQLAPDDFELTRDYALNFFAAPQNGVTPDWTQAAAAWQQARRCARTPDERLNTWVFEARAWLAQQNWDKAQTCLHEAKALRPDSAIIQNLEQRLQNERAKQTPDPSASSANEPGVKP